MEIDLLPLHSSLSEHDAGRKKLTADLVASLIGEGIIIKKGAALVFLLETGGTEELFLKIYQNFSPPYRLLVTMKNNSLPAALEIMTFLNARGLKNQLLYGSPASIRRALSAKEEDIPRLTYLKITEPDLLKGVRLGEIGRPSSWLIASSCSKEDVRVAFGAELIRIPYEEFLIKIRNAESFLPPAVLKIKKRHEGFPALDGALRIHGALLSLIVEHHLQGFTLRCFDLLSIEHNTACLALALLNDDRVIAACEGDVPALLSMMIVYKALGLLSFMVNPSSYDESTRELILAHCTVPLAMCRKYQLATHFESGLGVAIKGELPKGDVTVFKIAPDLQRALCLEGTIIDRPVGPGFCRTGIRVFFPFDIRGLFLDPPGNHLIVVSGHHAAELKRFLMGSGPDPH